MLKVAAYAIALNEAANIEQWLATTATADYRLIADTGSTDNTIKLARAAGVHVTRISVEPFRFDDAWNVALALLPHDIDVCIPADLDTILPEHWHAVILGRWPDTRPTEMTCWLDADGLRWRMPFAHSRHGFRWKFPLHEVLVADPRVHPISIETGLTRTTGPSRQSTADKHERNIAMLEAAKTENPDDPRQLHYLGREKMYAGCYSDALVLLEEHTRTSDDASQRAESWRYIGDCMRKLLPVRLVPLDPYRTACEIDPDRRDGWVALADLCREQDRWQLCLEAAEHALAITERHRHFNWPLAWGERPYDTAALAAWFLGDHTKAIRYGEHAVELAPDDARIADNLRWYRHERTAA